MKAGKSHPRENRLETKEMMRITKEINEGWVLEYMNVFGLGKEIGCNLNVYWFRYPLYSYKYLIE